MILHPCRLAQACPKLSDHWLLPSLFPCRHQRVVVAVAAVVVVAAGEAVVAAAAETAGGVATRSAKSA